MDLIPDFNKDTLPPSMILIIMVTTFFFVAIAGTLFVVLAGSPWGLLSEAFIVIPAMIYVISNKFSFKAVFRFNKIPLKQFFYAFGVSLSSIVIVDEIDRLVMRIFPMPDFLIEALEQIVKVDGWVDYTVLIISVVVMAALAEEMIFRGMIQKSVESFKDPANAIVITAVIFAVVHFNPWTALQITLLGIVLGYLTWKSNSIYPAIMLHGMNNLFSVIMINLSEQNVVWYGAGDHVNAKWLVLALIVGPYSLWAFSQFSNTKS